MARVELTNPARTASCEHSIVILCRELAVCVAARSQPFDSSKAVLFLCKFRPSTNLFQFLVCWQAIVTRNTSPRSLLITPTFPSLYVVVVVPTLFPFTDPSLFHTVHHHNAPS
uniref:(northern house mosquito) hypothetical protein n=1 Tax=Culex pipiens TaxID=7175 RepID=A0A8D8FHX9_CULPI